MYRVGGEGVSIYKVQSRTASSSRFPSVPNALASLSLVERYRPRALFRTDAILLQPPHPLFTECIPHHPQDVRDGPDPPVSVSVVWGGIGLIAIRQQAVERRDLVGLSPVSYHYAYYLLHSGL